MDPTLRLPFLTATVLCLIAWKASAQPPGYSTAFTTVDEKTFYYQGGTGNTTFSTPDSFYSLDLTHSWDIFSPPWTPVHVSGTYPQRLSVSLGNTLVYSQSLRTLTTLNVVHSPTFATQFHLDTAAFYELSGLPPTQVSPNKTYGLSAAVDPTTNHVYIPGAYAGRALMLDYDLVTLSTTTQPMPISDNTNWSGYTFVWNEVRKSFFLWGGRGPSSSSYFYEFKPGCVNPWTELKSAGAVPLHLSESCMVSAYGGTKMLLFGGHTLDFTLFSKTLYTLNVETMTWSQEQLPITPENRAGMACSVSGDNFIIWGGYRNSTAGEREPAGETPLVYNFYLKTWTSFYVPGNHYSPKASAEPTETGTGGSVTETGTGAGKSESSRAVIIGGAVGGGVVVVGLVVGLVICRRHQRRKHQEHEHRVRGPEKDPSRDIIDDNDDSQFNNKEPVPPNSPHEIQENNLQPDDNSKQLQSPSELALKLPESYSTLPRVPVALPTTNYQWSPSTSMSVSTNYSLYPAPSTYSSSSSSSSSRPIPTTRSGYHTEQQHQYRTQPQQQQQGRRQPDASSFRQKNHNIYDDDDKINRAGGGSQAATRMSQRRPQDHSDSTRANEERTLTTAEQIEVLHEQVFALNFEMSRLQASLNS